LLGELSVTQGPYQELFKKINNRNNPNTREKWDEVVLELYRKLLSSQKVKSRTNDSYEEKVKENNRKMNAFNELITAVQDSKVDSKVREAFILEFQKVILSTKSDSKQMFDWEGVLEGEVELEEEAGKVALPRA